MWQRPNGAVHINQTPMTLKKQQRSFCLSFILVLCCAFVSLIPTTTGSSGRLPSLWSPNECYSQKVHSGKTNQRAAPPPDLCEAPWRGRYLQLGLRCLPPSLCCSQAVSSLWKFILITNLLSLNAPTHQTPSEFYQPDTHSSSQSPRPQFITHFHTPSLFTQLCWLLIALCFHRVIACVTKFKSLTCSLWLSLHPPPPQPLTARAKSSVRDSGKYAAE